MSLGFSYCCNTSCMFADVCDRSVVNFNDVQKKMLLDDRLITGYYLIDDSGSCDYFIPNEKAKVVRAADIFPWLREDNKMEGGD